MKFGGGYNRYTKNQQLFGNSNGYYNFNDGWDKTNLVPPPRTSRAIQCSTSCSD